MILDKIADIKRAKVEERKKGVPLNEIIKKLEGKSLTNSFEEVFKREFSIIGEFKKASPSKGIINENFNINEIQKVYEEIGINAFSVLTEEDYFLGRDEYLSYLSSSSNKPILRKDFIIDQYQIYESKLLGASSVLLIYSLLGEDTKRYYEIAKNIGLIPLVEVHNKKEILGALEIEGAIIGINNRDLKTFYTSLDVTRELIRYVPKDRVVISESGIRGLDDLIELKELGVKGALIGEAFMKNLNNLPLLSEIREFLKNAN